MPTQMLLPSKAVINDKKNLFISFLILPFTLLCFYFLPVLAGKTVGYLLSFTFYWLYCLIHGSLIKRGNMLSLYSLPPLKRQNILLTILCFVPATGAFVASFSQVYEELNTSLYLILLLAACINGFVEEFYWRGAFISRYKENTLRAFVFPALLFGCWHISVYVAPGVEYQGGFWPLVGGAFFMGLIWGLTALLQQRILIPTLAHVLTNFFAFSGLIVDNWVK